MFPSPRGVPGKWAHLALCSSEILAQDEQAATTWDLGGDGGAAGCCSACLPYDIAIMATPGGRPGSPKAFVKGRHIM